MLIRFTSIFLIAFLAFGCKGADKSGSAKKKKDVPAEPTAAPGFKTDITPAGALAIGVTAATSVAGSAGFGVKVSGDGAVLPPPGGLVLGLVGRSSGSFDLLDEGPSQDSVYTQCTNDSIPFSAEFTSPYLALDDAKFAGRFFTCRMTIPKDGDSIPGNLLQTRALLCLIDKAGITFTRDATPTNHEFSYGDDCMTPVFGPGEGTFTVDITARLEPAGSAYQKYIKFEHGPSDIEVWVAVSSSKVAIRKSDISNVGEIKSLSLLTVDLTANTLAFENIRMRNSTFRNVVPWYGFHGRILAHGTIDPTSGAFSAVDKFDGLYGYFNDGVNAIVSLQGDATHGYRGRVYGVPDGGMTASVADYPLQGDPPCYGGTACGAGIPWDDDADTDFFNYTKTANRTALLAVAATPAVLTLTTVDTALLAH